VAFVSVTRLRIRSWRFMPGFLLQTQRAIGQARDAGGFLGGSLLRDRNLTFWTMTLWQEQAAMRAYIASGPHLTAMPKLLNWCDEASIVHWTQDDGAAPGWLEADARMRQEGRPSKVHRPSAAHRDLAFDAPRLAAPLPIVPRRAAPAR
jgi:hypothetical protein